MTKKASLIWFGLIAVFAVASLAAAFQSDELLVDDEEFGLEGGFSSSSSSPSISTTQTSRSRKRSSESDDSKIQFTLEHAFGDSDDFYPTGTFSARLKTWNHGAQTLTKLRFSRNAFTDVDKDKFLKLLEGDDFYKIRLPSNVLSPPGREYIVSSVKARCLAREGLDEHIVIHTDGPHILAVNYGSTAACPYPRQQKKPVKWSFNSHTILKNSEQAQRTPVFTEEVSVGENGEVEIKQPEKSFWAKYWMYLIPLGLIVMNVITQAMNMPEEGQAGSQAAAGQRVPSAAVRRR